jgi:hypothetical protein
VVCSPGSSDRNWESIYSVQGTFASMHHYLLCDICYMIHVFEREADPDLNVPVVRMPATGRVTNRTWGLSNLRTCALRSLSLLVLMRPPYATWLPLLYPALSERRGCPWSLIPRNSLAARATRTGSLISKNWER